MPRNVRLSADVCVVGAGPAGSVLAIRLAQLGHDVVLVERAAFPRRHLGESLSPGVFPLLASSGIPVPDAATRVHRVRVSWGRGVEQREDPAGGGRLVDRGRFDATLVDAARAAGVRVLQPATISPSDVHARFTADATGRSSFLTADRRRTGPRTTAFHMYWSGPDVPDDPSIEALDEGWAWSVPLPDGTCNTLVFADTDALRARRVDPVAILKRLLPRSARFETRVRGADATPYVDRAAITTTSIKVGDAALALDPLSSSGVQKAIQTSLAGAIVVNTLLSRPESADAALQFYRDLLFAASRRHARWAAGYYAEVLRRCDTAFWRSRSGAAQTRRRADAPTRGALASMIDRPLRLSRRAEFVETPVLEGDFVTMKRAVRHPELETPVAWVGGLGIADLAAELRPGMTAAEAARAWSARMPMKSGLGVASWMVRHGILVPAKRPPAVRVSLES